MPVQKGVATFTLDYGKCPRWLFERMVALGREMVRTIVSEEGSDEFVKRIGNPVWFQSLGTVLAFDWNASGLTTILTAALKEAIRGEEKNLGVFICGGKGKTSRRTPDQIKEWGNRLSLPDEKINSLVYNSKMAAKIDSALIQDSYQIYHHAFFFTKNGSWTVVQQGMNASLKSARRYHWHSENIKDLICEPHTGIVSAETSDSVLNLTAEKSGKNRNIGAELISQNFNALMKDIKILRKYSNSLSKTLTIQKSDGQLSLLELADTEFVYHPVIHEDFNKSRYLEKILWKLCDEKPENYEKIVATAGVGPKTVRALSLVAEIIYGAAPSYEDPARYSFAHGGKDATPYPVDYETYDKTIEIMKKYVQKIKIPLVQKFEILKELSV